MDTNIIGTITELKCITYFLELGYNVSIPQSPSRYDFILDIGTELLKVQVKTSRLKDECITFNTASCRRVKGVYAHVDYKNDNIDYFCTFYDNECYLVPVSECGRDSKRLRTTPTKNGQVNNISFAKNYIAKVVLERR